MGPRVCGSTENQTCLANGFGKGDDNSTIHLPSPGSHGSYALKLLIPVYANEILAISLTAWNKEGGRRWRELREMGKEEKEGESTRVKRSKQGRQEEPKKQRMQRC